MYRDTNDREKEDEAKEEEVKIKRTTGSGRREEFGVVEVVGAISSLQPLGRF